MKFLSPEVALCLYKSPYSLAWNTVVTSWLVSLVVTWNFQISYKNRYEDCQSFTCCLSWTLGSWLKCSQLKSFLYVLLWYFFRCSSEPAQLFPLPFSQGRSIHCSDRLNDFSVTILRYYKDVYVNSFLPCTARLWNCLPIEFFPLIYDLNGFKSRINKHLLTVVSF